MKTFDVRSHLSPPEGAGHPIILHIQQCFERITSGLYGRRSCISGSRCPECTKQVKLVPREDSISSTDVHSFCADESGPRDRQLIHSLFLKPYRLRQSITLFLKPYKLRQSITNCVSSQGGIYLLPLHMRNVINEKK